MEKNNHRYPLIDFPQHFMCPISMELMNDPVTISTGVTYDRKSIEKWFRVYRKKTCPATMQYIDTFDLTPNHTLKRLIVAWQDSQPFPPPPPQSTQGEVASVFEKIAATPFKVSCLGKLRLIVEAGDDNSKEEFKKSGGVEMLLAIISQIPVEISDFEACEEALGILHHFQIDECEFMMNPNCMQSVAMMLQRGSSRARFFAITTFQKFIARNDVVDEDEGVNFLKPLLETTSDEICNRASSCALQLLVEILRNSKKLRVKAVEAGAIRTLIELLPESRNRSRCEKIMEVVKLLCECADGRLAFVEHRLGIAAVAKKLVGVSIGATRIGVKILWLILSFLPIDRVLEEMMVCGAMEKLVAVMEIGGRGCGGGGGGGMTSTRERVVKILKMHGGRWRRYPCFPTELNNYL